MSPRHKCSYDACGNNRTLIRKLFFKFPVQIIEQCKQWVTNSGNSKLFGIDDDKLKEKVLSDDHFDPKSYYNSGNRKLLYVGAVPHNYGQSDVPRQISDVKYLILGIIA